MDIEHAIKELQETVVVMTHIQAQHAAMAKDHSQWLADHSKAIVEIRELQRSTDDRIEKLVSAIGTLISKIPNPPTA
jgi:RNA polymerase-binding transcription factor DksA